MPGVKDSYHVAAGNGEAGFTLIELMVVIVISSVLIGVASPHLALFYRGIKIDGATRQVKLFLDNARETALSERRKCRVSIAPDWQRMTLLVQSEDPEKSAEYSKAEGRLAKLAMLPEIEIDEITKDGAKLPRSSEVVLEIFPLYVPQAASFAVKDGAGNRRNVTMEAGSGRVRIEEE
jgi:prepilin-type N-terminal cleavage/methylation domain-containing protein